MNYFNGCNKQTDCKFHLKKPSITGVIIYIVAPINLYKRIFGTCMAIVLLSLTACNNTSTQGVAFNDTAVSCETNLPSRLTVADTTSYKLGPDNSSTEGMKWIPGGETLLGASDDEGRADEYP